MKDPALGRFIDRRDERRPIGRLGLGATRMFAQSAQTREHTSISKRAAICLARTLCCGFNIGHTKGTTLLCERRFVNGSDVWRLFEWPRVRGFEDVGWW